MSTNFLFSKVCWHCPAMFCLCTSSTLSTHNLNFHWGWRWWDQIQATFKKIFYFTKITFKNYKTDQFYSIVNCLWQFDYGTSRNANFNGSNNFCYKMAWFISLSLICSHGKCYPRKVSFFYALICIIVFIFPFTLHTVFPHIIAPATILFWIHKSLKISYNFLIKFSLM